VQILLQLKGAGYVSSTRGAAGGYQLLRPPEDISLGEVMAVIEGPADIAGSASPTSAAGKVLADAWREVSEVEQQTLHSLTFAELIERAREQSEAMYYI
jgi:Rrf2 family cysteine metabolism transcriptional repressor